ncbi:hypothetical protein ACHAAC_09850, partial [Aeromicrobium sp. CF4.19]
MDATPDDVKVLMMVDSRFSPRMRLDLQQRMWDVWLSGREMDVAGAAVGLDRKSVFNRVSQA